MKTIQRPSISTLSREALGFALLQGSGNSTWPTANDALFIPFTIRRYALVQRMFSINNNVASGNLDLGIFTSDGTRIVSTGSTAQSGTSQKQFFPLFSPPRYLSPNQYYMAIAMNNTTGGIRRLNISIIRQQMAGMLKATSAFPLPASVVFTTVTATYIPLIGMDLVGTL